MRKGYLVAALVVFLFSISIPCLGRSYLQRNLLSEEDHPDLSQELHLEIQLMGR